MSKQPVVVTGATGFIGQEVVRELTSRGHRVIIVSRSPAEARTTFPDAFGVIGYEGQALEDAIITSGRVITLAGQSPLLGRWTEKFKAGMYESRVGGARRVAAALKRCELPNKVLVDASGINLFEPGGDAVVNEASATWKAWVANMLTDKEAANATSGARCVELRIGLSLAKGPGPLEFIEKPFRSGMGGHLGDGMHFVPWIHNADMARMFATALEDERWQGVFVAAAPEPVRAKELSIAIGQRLNRKSWAHMPAFMAKLMMGEMSTLVLSSYRAQPSRALGLGFEFKYPTLTRAFDDIYAAAAQQVRVEAARAA